MYSAFKDFGFKKQKETLEYLGYSKQELYDKLSVYLNKLCIECKKVKLTLHNCQIDHIIPQGSAESKKDLIKLNQLDNLRLICGPCNLAKLPSDKKFIEKNKKKRK